LCRRKQEQAALIRLKFLDEQDLLSRKRMEKLLPAEQLHSAEREWGKKKNSE